MYKASPCIQQNLKKHITGGKTMLAFSTILVSIVGAGSLAVSFVEYALTRKKKQLKTENNQ
jgi:NhaP-type Na+/H+ or K+/H+ antiporter